MMHTPFVTPIRSFLLVTALIVQGGTWGAVVQAADAVPVISLGERRELFVDRTLLEKSSGAIELRLQEPRDEGIAFPFDQAWEGAFSGYVTILRDGEQYLAYYRGLPKPRADGSDSEQTCLTTSRDGIHWTKPQLGQFAFEGSKQNNIILGGAAPFSHNFCPMLDPRPETPASERFKALAGTARTGLVPFVSGDGIHWKKWQDQAVIRNGAFDSQNVPFWSAAEGKYLCYFRTFKDDYRRISRSTSDDFRNWSAPQLMEYDQGPVEHMYTNQTSAYYRAPHLYVSIAARFVPGRQVLTPEQAREIRVDPGYFHDCSDAVLMTTRGDTLYHRQFREGFLKPGLGWENWVSRTNYPALNVVPTEPGRMSFYVNQNYGQPTAHLHRYSLRVDGFSALHANYTGGEVVTRPFTFGGTRLTVNFATSAVGSLRCELQKPDGTPLPGWTLADCQELIGNELDRTVQWGPSARLSELAGQVVRLRISMKDADLYSFQFMR